MRASIAQSIVLIGANGQSEKSLSILPETTRARRAASMTVVRDWKRNPFYEVKAPFFLVVSSSLLNSKRLSTKFKAPFY
jgi:hypothetical protein